MRHSALSARGGAGGFPDLASRGRLIAGQRVSRSRSRRRVARRARQVAGRAALVGLGAAGLAAAALLAGWLLASPRFAVASVDVSGQNRLSREAIEEAAGVEPGINIFALRPSAVVRPPQAPPLVAP